MRTVVKGYVILIRFLFPNVESTIAMLAYGVLFKIFKIFFILFRKYPRRQVSFLQAWNMTTSLKRVEVTTLKSRGPS